MSKDVPEDKKVVAGVLALLLGGFGIHKFYLGRKKAGLVFLLFFWTAIPAMVAFVDGVYILAKGKQLV